LRVRVFDAGTGKELRTFNGPDDGNLLVSRDNQRWVSVGETSVVRSFATEGAGRVEIRRALKIDDPKTIRGAAVSPDGKTLGIWESARETAGRRNDSASWL